ncbi:insulinase family protein [Sphingomonas sinipercae]|uniref:Insulinase family protein n=1 Tax=Sphingomonas sinipercae TaxID=2714944 RepID=A0A6G7ZR69_9SPHN|nr:pitrilysin family protein [Sphingomonas sinipercae]QIL03412.1 insulinase family protein [Sphingomonas sinipercae]
MFNLRRLSVLLVSASTLSACATAPQVAVPDAPSFTATTQPATPQPAPVSALVSEVSIPHSGFKLANGLTVIVHEDHKAPVVAVSTWYNVGSKDEPKGKTGFAHLFEHLMFNGSDNLPGDYFEYLQQIGATDYNGTTWFDRTNYFQTVPRSALERALFMESDRMGYLLGAVTQAKLDNQRGVVQNEKRQGDNQPGGLVEYEVLENLFPDGHPYQHSTIGSMSDLDAASLADVKQWFIDKYAPNNAVLVLAGDIDAAEARPLVEKYFGAIERGPVNVPAAADVPTLSASKSIVMKDRVAATEIQRHWAVPGLLSDQRAALDIGASILGGLASSRLDRILVRDEKLAVSVSTGSQPFQRIGMFQVGVTVKPGVDPALVEKRLDEIIADFVANGPTEDEVRRAATQEISGEIRGLEQVGGFGGKAVALAEGQVYAGDSDFYKKTLDRFANVTSADVKAAMQQWLSRPVLAIRLEPGDRPEYRESGFKPKRGKSADIRTPKVKRVLPPLGEPAPLDFPEVQHSALSNGVRVHYAQRTTVPLTQVGLAFDAGFAADAPGRRGLQNLTLSLLDEGAAGRSSQALAEEEERLGARISAGGGADQSSVSMSALSANLGASLDLLADLVQRPDFNPADIDRVRTQVLTAISQQQKDPQDIANRVLPALLYGENHPYGGTQYGNPEAVKSFTRADLASFHQRWLRPDNLEIFVVSNLPLADVRQKLERAFGGWTAPAVPKGVKAFGATPKRALAERIVLIDRPGSPQSYIMAGQVTPVDPRSDVTALNSANDILGSSFLSRINMNLREDKGWSYGVRGTTQINAKVVPYIVTAPVQADRTGDSIRELRKDIRDILTTKGVTSAELDRTIANRMKQLPGQFETSGAVLGAMQSNALLGRPDNYYELLADRYRGQTRASLDAALRSAIDPNGFVWIVVGDAAKVRPQLKALKLPIEEIEPR